MRRLDKGFETFEKSWMNSLQKPVWLRKLRTPFTDVEGGSFSMISILAQSTSILLPDMRCPSTMPYLNIKWHFSPFKTKLVSMHLFSTKVRLWRQFSNVEPIKEKSSMKASMEFLTMSENIAIMHI